MPAFETHECENCGDQFRAVEGSNAAETRYRSPRCASEGKGLA